MRVAGLVADLLMRTCNASSVERQSFIDGSRYMIRFSDNHNMEVHLVDKGERLFAEFWVNTYATPLMIIEYVYTDIKPSSICEEICELIRIINESFMKQGEKSNRNQAVQPR
ncbi:hypothetical protein [Vulcanisaeta distributa]|uniref:hypothetical protein n=1 Tax=Vulcanisaeta distributa TaxID=164451 RepID=UPI0006CF754F|nr:hypothetical protein [Vulcanisaeta distributa]